VNRKRPARRPGKAAPKLPRPAAHPRRNILVAGFVLAGAIAAVLLVSRWQHQAPQHPPGPQDALDPRDAYVTGLTLGKQGQHLASIPYFRRALDAPVDSWGPHTDYAVALFNASLQIGVRAGVPYAVTRSSIERVTFVRESIRQIEAAEQLTQRPEELALLEIRRAALMRVWGLPWDALLSYRRAASAAPKWLDLARRVDAYTTYMRTAGSAGAAAAETLLARPL
jgi:hypothetical protein